MRVKLAFVGKFRERTSLAAEYSIITGRINGKDIAAVVLALHY
jgi:hypothetical protein